MTDRTDVMAGISGRAADLLASWYPDEPHALRWRKVKRRAQRVTHIAADTPDGTVREPRVPFGEGREVAGACGDCGVRPGQLHVPSCDQERCPECSGQLLSSGTFGSCELGERGRFQEMEAEA